MKQSIVWHVNCLKNMEKNKERCARVLERAKNDFEKITLDILSYRKQLNEAIKKKKDGFDKDKFLIKEKKNG